MPKLRFKFESIKKPFSKTCAYLNIEADQFIDACNGPFSPLLDLNEVHIYLSGWYSNFHKANLSSRGVGSGLVDIIFDHDAQIIRFRKPNQDESDYSRITIEQP